MSVSIPPESNENQVGSAAPEAGFSRRRWWYTVVAINIAAILFLDLCTAMVIMPVRMHKMPILHYYYGHHLLPNASGPDYWGRNGKKRLMTNSLGFKDNRVRKVPLDTDKKRILFMGDSFVEGLGIEYPETFVGRVQARLDTSKYDILNAGVRWYGPWHYRYKTVYLLQKVKLSFDKLIVFIDHSDIPDGIACRLNYWQWPINTHSNIFFRVNRKLYTKSFIINSINRLKHKKLLKDYWNVRETVFPSQRHFMTVQELWATDSRIFRQFGERGLKLAVQDMDRLYHVCRDSGIGLSIAVFPYPTHIKPQGLNSIQRKTWKQFCRERDLEFIDLFPVFINDSLEHAAAVQRYFIPNDFHWNEAGHALVAGEVLKHIH